MKIINNLKFKDSRDKAFADMQVSLFIDRFIRGDNIKYVEIDKNDIRIFNSVNGGFRCFNRNLTTNTAQEMLSYIVGMNEGYNYLNQ